MIEPLPCRVIGSPKTWIGSTVPVKLRPTTPSRASRGTLKKVSSPKTVASGRLPPAQLTSTSTRPQLPSNVCRAASRLSSSRTSAGKVIAPWPADSICCATCCAFCARRPSTATRAPAAARPRDIAPPSTPVPPVTTATFPSSENCSQMLMAYSWLREVRQGAKFLPALPRLLRLDWTIIGKQSD